MKLSDVISDQELLDAFEQDALDRDFSTSDPELHNEAMKIFPLTADAIFKEASGFSLDPYEVDASFRYTIFLIEKAINKKYGTVIVAG